VSSCNLGTLTSWNPLGHSKPVTGLLYLYGTLYKSRIYLSISDDIALSEAFYELPRIREYNPTHNKNAFEKIENFEGLNRKRSIKPKRLSSIPVRHKQEKQYAYKRNSGVRSSNHYCNRKATSISQAECVFVALGVQHATRVSSVACPVQLYFSRVTS
jgi:hypothetical protein